MPSLAKQGACGNGVIGRIPRAAHWGSAGQLVRQADLVSITRQDRRIAAELAQRGKLIPVVFVRNDVISALGTGSRPRSALAHRLSQRDGWLDENVRWCCDHRSYRRVGAAVYVCTANGDC